MFSFFESSKMDENIKIIVKWSGKEYEISDLTENDTVEKLKDSIYKVTGVRPPRQKLLNLKHKGKRDNQNFSYTTFQCLLSPGGTKNQEFYLWKCFS